MANNEVGITIDLRQSPDKIGEVIFDLGISPIIMEILRRQGEKQALLLISSLVSCLAGAGAAINEENGIQQLLKILNDIADFHNKNVRQKRC